MKVLHSIGLYMLCDKSLQLCQTPCDPMDCSLPDFSVHGTLGRNTGMGCHALLQELFPTQGIKPTSLMSSVMADRFFTTRATWEAHVYIWSSHTHTHTHIYMLSVSNPKCKKKSSSQIYI